VKRRVLLRAFCGWTVFVFVVLIKNMLTDDDHAASFRIVHSVLALISIGFAVACWPLAKRIPSDEN
jgi:Na+/melibiose symporter-like transporter